MEIGLVDAGDFGTIFSKIGDLKRNISSAIRGKDSEIELLVTTVIAGESILIQDVPGVGKTTLAKALAGSLDLDFQRVQCTPDLMPADVFGVSIFNPKTAEFSFRKGPVFTNILLVDEINRATPRTQSALLEANGRAPGYDRRNDSRTAVTLYGYCHGKPDWLSRYFSVA